MKTGVILYSHLSNESARSVAEWYATGLRERGHKDVRVAYHKGNPGIEETLRGMNVHGMNNTFVVIPLLLSEGDLSTWVLPKKMAMPDNSCSYTYLTGMHIAIRFSTAIGESDALSETVLKRVKEKGAHKDDGILLVSKGSRLSMNVKTLNRIAGYVEGHGFGNVSLAVLDGEGPSIASSIGSLMEKDVKRLIIVPLFLTQCRSVTETIPSLVRDSCHLIPVLFADVIGTDELILDDMDKKIPEGW